MLRFSQTPSPSPSSNSQSFLLLRGSLNTISQGDFSRPNISESSSRKGRETSLEMKWEDKLNLPESFLVCTMELLVGVKFRGADCLKAAVAKLPHEESLSTATTAPLFSLSCKYLMNRCSHTYPAGARAGYISRLLKLLNPAGDWGYPLWTALMSPTPPLLKYVTHGSGVLTCIFPSPTLSDSALLILCQDCIALSSLLGTS